MGLYFSSKAAQLLFQVSIVFLVTPWLAMLLRLFVRLRMMKNFGWDDGVMVLTMLLWTVICTTNLTKKAAAPDKVMVYSELEHIATKVLISSTFYVTTMILFKISLGLFYLRFLLETWQRRTVYLGVATSTMTGIGLVFLLLFQCGPPSHYLANQLAGRCGAWNVLQPLNYAYAGINALTDLMFALIPIAAIRTMQLTRYEKVSASIILSLGMIGTVIAFVRMRYLGEFNPNKHLFHSETVVIISVVELGIGLTASSCATLRPLFSLCLQRVKTTVGSRSTQADSIPSHVNYDKAHKDMLEALTEDQRGHSVMSGKSQDPDGFHAYGRSDLEKGMAISVSEAVESPK